MPEVRASFERYWLQLKDDIGGYRFPIPELIVCFGFISVYIIEEVLNAVLGSGRQRTESISIHSSALFNSGNTREGHDKSATYGSTTIKHTPSNDLHDASPVSSKFSIRGMIIICALSFHSIFEGFAVGLQENEKETWTLFFAVAVHKFVIAFVVGLEVYSQSTYAIAVIIYMAIFAVMSPLGMFIAMVTESSLEGSADLAVGTLNGLATGTLVYVTFFEVLQRQKYSNLSGLLQLFAMLVGFGLMIIVQWLTDQ
ncbi:zinc transporter ZIP1-like [Limulus polyphemus]|uniref:Zinc transporter ZIP1-like n=1 Tax=Limulus polyphemus TaxID=6850 RepID=A0ABM1T2I9_LIMPO|nr:zinc transporter ZIP1-like [Limulus polyphemus]